MSKKILIVDDEPHIQALLVQTLEDLEDRGVELLTAGNGKEAWETARRAIPDLIILDVMMPQMNGYRVCERVKSEPDLADVYVILLTAKGQEIDRLRGQQVGADEYITKPFDPDYLVERAEAILGLDEQSAD